MGWPAKTRRGLGSLRRVVWSVIIGSRVAPSGVTRIWGGGRGQDVLRCGSKGGPEISALGLAGWRAGRSEGRQDHHKQDGCVHACTDPRSKVHFGKTQRAGLTSAMGFPRVAHSSDNLDRREGQVHMQVDSQEAIKLFPVQDVVEKGEVH